MKHLMLFSLLFGIMNIPMISAQTGNQLVYQSKSLSIKEVEKDLFVHESYLQTVNFGKVGCNGLIYVSGDEAIVFDTPVNDRVAIELIEWLEKKHKKRITTIVVTHFHNDCLGGLKPFHDNGTKSYANQLTIELAKEDKVEALPQHSFQKEIDFKVGGQTVMAKFFGEGHTRDNIVGYVPAKKALFGGCLVKTMNAGKGYLGDANTASWTSTVERIKNEFPELKVVVPGHGNWGGIELLTYTAKLFEEGN